MKLSKKFAGALLGLAVVAMAVPASAGQLEVRGIGALPEDAEIYDLSNTKSNPLLLYLYKEADEDCDPWLLEPRDSVISMGRLKYDANICKIRVGGDARKKVEICPRMTGTYYLKIRTNKYIRPNDRVRVQYVVYQNGKAYNVKLYIRFTKKEFGRDPLVLTQVLLANSLPIDAKGGSIDLAEDFDHFRTAEADFGKNVTPGKRFIDIRVNQTDFDNDGDPDYSLKKIVLVKKDGCSRRIYNKTNHSLTNMKKIVITVKNENEPEFYKKENCAFRGCTKLFPYTETYTILL